MKSLGLKLLKSNTFFFIITSTLVLSLNLTPLVAHILHSPSGRTFALIHNNTQDFFFYQSLMNEGANGAWLTSDPYTTETHQSSVIFSYFLWLGKVSKVLGLPYAITYHLVRILLSLFFLFTIYYLLFTISFPYPRLTFFFFLFASPLMHQINDYGKIISVPYMNWWTGMDAIRRVAYLPHHMVGGLFLVLTIILLIRYFYNPKIKYLVWLIVIGAFLAFIHTPSLFIILIILPPSLLLFSFFPSKFSIGLLVYWVIGLFLLFLMISQTNRGFPWSQYIEWERKLQFPLDRELIGALGVLFSLAIIGVVKAFFSKRFDYILIACWFAVPLLIIPFASKLNLSNIRLIQGIPYLPLAILATLGLKTIIDFIFSSKICAVVKRFGGGKEIKTPRGWPNGLPRGGGISIIIVLLIFIAFTLPTLSWSLRDQIREYWPIFGNVYLDNRLYNAFAFINQNSPAKTITLSTFYTGNYLPAFTHTVSFIGHFGYTYNIEEKQVHVRKFFENKMQDTEAKEFLLNNKITLVFQGPEEKPIYNGYLYPTLLKPVYDREEATIYTPNF